MADIDDLEDDENFDKPDPKAQLHRAGKQHKDEQDDFEENENEDAELEELEVEIEDEPKTEKKLNNRGGDRPKVRSEEERFGRRRPKKVNESRQVRELEGLLNQERQRNDQLNERLTTVEANTTTMVDSTIDSQIAEANRYLETAKQRHAQAVKDGDGDSAAEALDVMLEAKETVAALKASKKAPVVRRDANPQDNQRKNIPKVDPVVIRKFDTWNDKNEWYDRNLGDKFSRIAFHIDNAINAEGFDPRTQEYWDELDARLRENPTLAREVFADDDYEDEGEHEVSRPTRRESVQTKKSTPLNERSTTSQTGKKIVVSRARADAMREMGLQPGTSEWKKMAKKYEAYDKQRSA